MPFSVPLFIFCLFPFLLLVSVLSLIYNNNLQIVNAIKTDFKDFKYVTNFFSFFTQLFKEIGLLLLKIFEFIFSITKIDILYKSAINNNIKIWNFLLFLINIICYCFAGIKQINIIVPIIILGYFGGLAIQHFKYKKLTLMLFVLSNVTILSFFKYFKFENIIAPIGISFITFKLLSYLCDVYYGKNDAQRNPFDFLQYLMFFPQVVSGPLMRYNDFNTQLQNRTIVFDEVIIGIKRFIIGLAKKVIIADTLGAIVDRIFKLQTNEFGSSVAWVGALFYTLQLYYDFSGYCDMSIGIAKLMGFNTPENFNYPYISKSITEFWRRWHITLGSWFRDYVYIPLGGNRVSKTKMFVNLWVVFLLTGIWHGNTWNFVIWGCLHGIFNCFEKMTGWNNEKENKTLTILQHIYCLAVVIFGWVLFRSPDLSYSLSYIKNMFGMLNSVEQFGLDYYIGRLEIYTFIWAVIGATPVFKNLVYKKNNLLIDLSLIVLLIVSVSFVVSSTYQSFLYFQF